MMNQTDVERRARKAAEVRHAEEVKRRKGVEQQFSQSQAELKELKLIFVQEQAAHGATRAELRTTAQTLESTQESLSVSEAGRTQAEEDLAACEEQVRTLRLDHAEALRRKQRLMELEMLEEKRRMRSVLLAEICGDFEKQLADQEAQFKAEYAELSARAEECEAERKVLLQREFALTHQVNTLKSDLRAEELAHTKAKVRGVCGVVASCCCCV